MRLSIWVVLLAFIISSCDSNRVYENIADFNNAYWLADTVKSFEFTIDKINTEHNIVFNIRNGIEYPHSNIYVHYAISDSTNQVIDEELRNFQLFHPKSGYPFGNGSGNIKDHQFDLLVDYKFPYPGKYQISFEQYMRYDSLPQVYSIGVRIETPE